MSGKIKAEFIVKGRVQGVGYRYFTSITAKNLGITGTVRNLANNDVEVVAEGDEKMIKEFLNKSTLQGDISFPVQLAIWILLFC